MLPIFIFATILQHENTGATIFQIYVAFFIFFYYFYTYVLLNLAHFDFFWRICIYVALKLKTPKNVAPFFIYFFCLYIPKNICGIFPFFCCKGVFPLKEQIPPTFKNRLKNGFHFPLCITRIYAKPQASFLCMYFSFSFFATFILQDNIQQKYDHFANIFCNFMAKNLWGRVLCSIFFYNIFL